MKKNIYKIGAMLAIVLLIMTTVSAAVSGSIPDEAKSSYQKAEDYYNEVVPFYLSARSDWSMARNRLRQNRNPANLENATDAAKEFLIKSAEALAAYLNKLARYVEEESVLEDHEKEAIISQLEDYIEWIEEKQSQIPEIETFRELRELIQTVRNEWKEIRRCVKDTIGRILSAKIEWLIDRAEDIADKIEDVIERLEELEKPVEDLKLLLEDVREKIELAKDKYDEAKNRYQQIQSVSDFNSLFNNARRFMVGAFQYMRKIFQNLRTMVEIIKTYRTGEVYVSGTGILIAEGDGIATLSGNGTIDVSGNGTLVVTDDGGDAQIDVSGFGFKNHTGNTYYYEGTGSALISGSNITVVVNGTDIDLWAKGTGWALLNGTGTYRKFRNRTVVDAVWSTATIEV
jgi:tetratricopeptide (TPR) repeat protein